MASGASGSAPGARGPIALRPLGTFPPRRESVFEDPGDERSWHVSQTFESLMRYYEGRDPGWYASAVRGLTDCASVVELGCGPVLALRALRDSGVQHVLGLDRWPGFVEVGQRHGVPVLLHDLTLPLPFIRSASVDGVFSHYALDYMSPIGVRQALREARRVLRPGGRLLVFLAAVGLGDGEEARTIPYTPDTMLRIMAEAGFEEAAAEAPGRNTVARARAGAPTGLLGAAALQVDGEAQLSAGFGAAASRVAVDLSGDGWRSRHEIELRAPAASGEISGVNETAVFARVQRIAPEVWELQLCAWLGGLPAYAGALRLAGRPEELKIDCDAPLEHASSWAPEVSCLAPPAVVQIAAGSRPDVIRSGIRITTAPSTTVELDPLIAVDLRDAPGTSAESLDVAWLDGRLHAIALEAGQLRSGGPILWWAAGRGAPVLVFAASWQEGLAASRAMKLLSPPPIVLLDPSLEGRRGDPAGFREALDWARSARHLHLATTPSTMAGVPENATLNALLPAADGGDPIDVPPEALENLRYLCERALLLRLRATSGRKAWELGRRQSLEMTSTISVE